MLTPSKKRGLSPILHILHHEKILHSNGVHQINLTTTVRNYDITSSNVVLMYLFSNINLYNKLMKAEKNTLGAL